MRTRKLRQSRTNRALQNDLEENNVEEGLSRTVSKLIPLLRQFARGKYGVALGGAHAKGVDDAESDIDLYLFTRQTLPNDERARLCEPYNPDIAGDKKLEAALSHLPLQPQNFALRVRRLLSPSAPADHALLSWQREELCLLLDEVQVLIPIC